MTLQNCAARYEPCQFWTQLKIALGSGILRSAFNALKSQPVVGYEFGRFFGPSLDLLDFGGISFDQQRYQNGTAGNLH